MVRKHKGSKQDTVSVTFEYDGTPWCESVTLAGDFNQWSHESLPLNRPRGGDSPWEITIELPRGQSFEYRYVVNRVTWCVDEKAEDQVATPSGEFNSLVHT